jgi:hypothetical protein
MLIKENRPFLLIESKLSNDTPGKSLISFQNMLNIDAVLLVDKPGICNKNQTSRIEF